ncbi:branched-chain-amino-acid aminotransferase 2 [Oscillospiraceae bacterium]|nr:branched-chain-amino-acid aminotransferase 2 [Oscillospiraceae bacterium]BDF73294.1 branched-chain-amino-acid aminotransferase 2 [Oscillospiraceae bacterium]
MYEYPVTRSSTLKPKPDPKTLVFGKTFTDHMFLMDYDAGQGWHDGRIVPYAPLALDPSAMVFHYAQEVFEGMKAYRTPDGGVQLFRPMENVKRINSSCERLCIPQLPEEAAFEAIRQLVKLEADWVPDAPGTSLYIRPFIIATDASLGVHASHSYLFCVICCPVGAYYKEGINPVRIYVENDDVRAVHGGTGHTKCGGNYAASIRASERAEQRGYAQVLWLDGVERRYIEEVGSMNVMFKVAGEVITPALTGSVLPGITRKSCLDLLRAWDVPVSERLITAEELFDAAESGALEEAWGTGTAAVVSPIGEMGWSERSCTIGGEQIGALTQKLYDTLTGIQWGALEDPYGWTVKIC